LFPVQGIEDRVGFWVAVFTEYGENDLIIHDTERVDLVYAVVEPDARRSGVERVQRLLDEVRRQIDTPDRLSDDARELYDRIEADGVRLTAGDIAVLRGRIHVQRGIKERFEAGIVRSGRYVAFFREVFDEVGVPAAAALLPLVESSFENSARSFAGAVGIWQFMPATGRQYMTVSRGRDDRTNPAIATRAAARLLGSNFERLRSWPLAITAYNHGTGGMARAQAAHGSDMTEIIRNYNGRTFGYASKNFYAEFVAAVTVYDDYEYYFGPIALDSPIDLSTPAVRVASGRTLDAGSGPTYRVRVGDTLSAIATSQGTSVTELMALNRLPSDRIFAGETLLVGVSGGTGLTSEYRVQRGDTLSHIADRFGLRIGDLMNLNGLRESTIYAGQLLIVQ
jgi:membrane-bound lytic murein transglycosylase D